jgi:hypothetical protein
MTSVMEDLGAIRFGNADDGGDHVHWELIGDFGHEVDLTPRRGLVEYPLGALGDLLFEPTDHAGCEARADQLSELEVLGRVLGDEHDASPFLRERHDGRAVVRGERLPVTIRLLDLVVAEQRPELDIASEGRHMGAGMPEDGSDLAQFGIQPVRHPAPVQRRVEKVDIKYFGDGHGRNLAQAPGPKQRFQIAHQGGRRRYPQRLVQFQRGDPLTADQPQMHL